MSTIKIACDTSGEMVLVSIISPYSKFEYTFRADDFDLQLDRDKFLILDECDKVEEESQPVESPAEKKRRRAKEYYHENKERLNENSRKKYQEKKALKQQVEEPAAEVDDEEDSLEFDYDPSLSLEENATEAAQREYRQNYYQNRIKEVRQWYQDNKERVAKRQQTDEVRARFREQYHARRSNMTKQQIAAKNAIAVAQRKVRNAKLRAKYPGMKLKDAKAAQKAATSG